jgi:hypothetical protein
VLSEANIKEAFVSVAQYAKSLSFKEFEEGFGLEIPVLGSMKYETKVI